jgi:hypothetical protein
MKQNLRDKWVGVCSRMSGFSLLLALIMVLVSHSGLQAASTDWFKNAKYGISFHYLPGVNDIPVATDGGSNYGEATSAKINAATGISNWAQAVKDFDVAGFVGDVSRTGAGYVIFPVGQTSGYYSSYNYNYETASSTLRGEFTSYRDLIAEIGTALGNLNPPIKLIVYMGSEGAAVSGAVVHPDGSISNPGNAIQALYGAAGSNGRASNALTREILYNMISEWSTRWGTKVSGWWFDGVFAINQGNGNYDYNGWINPANANTTYNIQALINAARAGNSTSIVALNPGEINNGVTNFDPVATDVDYIAGETGPDATLNARFNCFPTSRYITKNSKNYQWHVWSYMGSWWGKPYESTKDKYADVNQLVDYVRYINVAGGVATIDMGIYKSGRLDNTQVTKMEAVKNVVKGSTAAVAQTDLALYKPSYLMNANCTYTLPPAMPAPIAASPVQSVAGPYPVNGNNGKYTDTDGTLIGAQAANEWAWSYLVDLASNVTFKSVKVVMPANDNYATEFAVEGAYSSSSNALLPATTWTNLKGTNLTLKTADGVAFTYGGKSLRYFIVNIPAGINRRFVRVRAITPNASGQTGTQMSIVELEVYNQTL